MFTPHLDELQSIAGSMHLMSLPSRDVSGGEWDALRSVSVRDMRRLRGAGYVSPRGERPDVFADLCHFPDTCSAVEWFVQTALKAIDERRRVAHYRRHQRFAESQGARSYFHYRDTLAVLAGFASYGEQRRAKEGACAPVKRALP